MQKMLSVAVVAGLFIAYIDYRPTWGDTGITAGVILLLCGLLVLALISAFVGAYAGWAFRAA